MLTYNLKRVITIMGMGSLIAAMRAAQAFIIAHLRRYPTKSPLRT